MNELTLRKCLEKDEFTQKLFKSVLARDELPTKISYPSCYIINTKPRNHPGEHWLALFYEKNGVATFFDSYAQSPDTYRLKSYLLKTSLDYQYNQKRIQGNSSFCGYYCLLFLLLKARNRSDIFFKYFTNNLELNDKIIQNFINFFTT